MGDLIKESGWSHTGEMYEAMDGQEHKTMIYFHKKCLCCHRDDEKSLR